MRSTALAAVSLMGCALSGGCAGWDDLQFRQDDRLTITAPENLATVDVPFTVAWEWAGPALRSGETYAVFVDRYPMAPGKDLHSVVDSVLACRGSADCLEPDYLRDNFNVYLTTQHSVEVDALPLATTEIADDGTYATIVILDRQGRRVGESVWNVSFKVAS